MGKVLAERGVKNVVTLTWKYAAGDESVAGFKDGFTKGGGKILKELTLPFPNVEFQPLLTEIASLKPDAVFVFFAGGGAAKFIKDWQAAGLKGKIPLYGAGFLTDGILEATGDAAEGLETTLHYGDGIDTPRNKRVPRGVSQGLQDASPTSTPCRATTPGCCSSRARRPSSGDLSKKKEFIAADGEGDDRQPARQVDAVEGAQPGAGHVPAQGRRQGEPRDRRGDAGARLPAADRCKMGG